MNYWLMKSEPDTFSIDDLKRDMITPWEGVRNFAARNHMMHMHTGDSILFYHSSCKIPGVYGIARIEKEAHPDASQFDKKSPYFEPRATREKPVWFCVDVIYDHHALYPFTLEAMKGDPKLKGMILFERSRLSVQPISEKHFTYIRSLLC